MSSDAVFLSTTPATTEGPLSGLRTHPVCLHFVRTICKDNWKPMLDAGWNNPRNIKWCGPHGMLHVIIAHFFFSHSPQLHNESVSSKDCEIAVKGPDYANGSIATVFITWSAGYEPQIEPNVLNLPFPLVLLYLHCILYLLLSNMFPRGLLLLIFIILQQLLDSSIFLF